MMGRQKYTYNGAVYCYNDIVSHNWSGQTFAMSEKQAASHAPAAARMTLMLWRPLTSTYPASATGSPVGAWKMIVWSYQVSRRWP